MVTYRTSQQQMNYVLSFGMSLMFMALMLGLIKSLVFDKLTTEERPGLLPLTSKQKAGGEPPLRRLRWFVINRQTGKTAALIYQRNDRWELYSVKTRQYTPIPVRPGRIHSDIAAFLEKSGYPGERYQMVTEPPPALLPQVIVEGGERVPYQYRNLITWIEEPLPDYSLSVELLPAIEAPTGERKVDIVLKQLKDGVESIQQSEHFRLFLSTMAKFHDYSIGNLILIMIQKPEATRVAGFNTWKDLGRWVKPGEKGIAILAPVMPPRPSCPKCGTKIRKGVRFCQQCGEQIEIEEGFEETPHYFKVVYVFDLAQTEGKPLPEFEVPSLTGEANEELFNKALTLARSQGLEVSFESKPDQDQSIKGFYTGKLIWVRPEEPRAQQLKTLLHELAHYYSEGVFLIPRRDAETIAESAAFAVGAHFGFDSGVRSFPYVAVWAQDKKVLEQNLAAIRKVTVTILESLEKAPSIELIPMIIQCAWCGKYMGEKPPYEDKGVTHTICAECMAKYFPKKGSENGDD